MELVDADGPPTGSATVDEAHRAPGQLHRAFSVFLRDPEGRVLLQQRAAIKTRFPLRWANTCCGHPRPGEALPTAAARRLREEIGVGGVELTEVGVYSYYAEDPTTGRVEYEYDHVLLGEVPAEPHLLLDPARGGGRLRWVPLDELAPAWPATSGRTPPGCPASPTASPAHLVRSNPSRKTTHRSGRVADEALTAGAVARRLGVAVTTLRTWHQRYGLGPSHHVPGPAPPLHPGGHGTAAGDAPAHGPGRYAGRGCRLGPPRASCIDRRGQAVATPRRR